MKTKHGGKRRGSGRKKKEPTELVTVRVPNGTKDEIKKMVKAHLNLTKT